mgnify:FL=1
MYYVPSLSTDSCKDGVLGVILLDAAYDCKYLTKQYPEDLLYGIYSNRKSICADTSTDCCAACTTVAVETECQDEVLGIQLADGSYSCKYLTEKLPEDAITGIYNSRESICANQQTKCCSSCKIVKEEAACNDGILGVRIAGGSYACKYLTNEYPEDRMIGIYNNRKSVCSMSTTNCCASCKVVAIETCEDEALGVQLAGGSYSCKYLTARYTEDNILGIYNSRATICKTSTTQCCASCKQVADEVSLVNRLHVLSK